MTLADILLIPTFFACLLFVGIVIRSAKYNNSIYQPYFIPGLVAKMSGALFIALFYKLYYGGGDTLNYHTAVLNLNEVFFQDFGLWFKMLFTNLAETENPEIRAVTYKYWLLGNEEAGPIIKVGGLLGLLCFNNFFCISILLGFFSFFPTFSLFKTFASLRKDQIKRIAWCVLFFPSIIVWGSGLFKDTLSFAGICVVTRCAYLILYEQKRHPKYFIAAFIGGWMAFTLKAYIVLAFLGPAVLLVFLRFRDQMIPNKQTRRIVTPVFLVGIGVAFLFAFQFISQYSDAYNIDSIQRKAYDTQWWHTQVVELYGEGGGGSYYTLGTPDPSMTGTITKILPAINVALFRPYLFEARSIIMLFSAAESTLLLLLTLYVIFYRKPIKTVGIIFQDPFIVFCLGFALILAFGVGFTSYNFGALVRYKIPLLPFYGFVLVSIYHEKQRIRG